MGLADGQVSGLSAQLAIKLPPFDIGVEVCGMVEAHATVEARATRLYRTISLYHYITISPYPHITTSITPHRQHDQRTADFYLYTLLPGQAHQFRIHRTRIENDPLWLQA